MKVPRAIDQNESICRSRSVAPSARAIPIAASRLPARAVECYLTCLSPKTNSTAATIYLTAIMDSRRSDILFLFRRFGDFALLEHLEHSIRHDESAEDVGGPEHHRNESQRVQQCRVRRPGDEHRAEYDDPVNGIRARHERG